MAGKRKKGKQKKKKKKGMGVARRQIRHIIDYRYKIIYTYLIKKYSNNNNKHMRSFWELKVLYNLEKNIQCPKG